MTMIATIGKKGISPMIAIVLMIAFTVAVGGILSLWLTTLTSTQTTTTGSEAEKQILCARSVLKIDEVTSKFGSNDTFNITVTYIYGTENIYYFNITFVDNVRNSLTVTPKVPDKNFNSSNPLQPGMIHVFRLDINRTADVQNVSAPNPTINHSTGFDLGGSSLQSVRVIAKCQDTYPISTECKSGQSCMV